MDREDLGLSAGPFQRFAGLLELNAPSSRTGRCSGPRSCSWPPAARPRSTTSVSRPEARGVIVGATFVGQDVAELAHAATIAIVGEVPIARLWHAVPAYPTMSEVWLRLLEAYGRPD